MEDVQHVMVSEQCVDDMIQFQAVPITNMIPNVDRQKEYRKKMLHELTVQEREEQRKRNSDRQRAYRERKSNQLEEARNQFAEQQKNQNVERQRQNSTNIPVEATVEDAQRVTIREQSVDGMVQFQTVPINNMIPNANQQKKYRKRKLTELTAQERKEQRK